MTDDEVLVALARSGGSVRGAARSLGVSAEAVSQRLYRRPGLGAEALALGWRRRGIPLPPRPTQDTPPVRTVRVALAISPRAKAVLDTIAHETNRTRGQVVEALILAARRTS